MGVTSSNKQVDVDRIDCDGSVKVTLALSASPDILTNPTDIVLVWFGYPRCRRKDERPDSPIRSAYKASETDPPGIFSPDSSELFCPVLAYLTPPDRVKGHWRP